MFVSTVEQLYSMSRDFEKQMYQLLLDVLRSSYSLNIFGGVKRPLYSNIRRIFRSILKHEFQFQFYYDELMNYMV